MLPSTASLASCGVNVDDCSAGLPNASSNRSVNDITKRFSNTIQFRQNGDFTLIAVNKQSDSPRVLSICHLFIVLHNNPIQCWNF